MATVRGPAPLETVLAEPDEEARVAALTAYIQAAEERVHTARQARRDLIARLRLRPVPVTWRRIAELTGSNESYWRNVVRRQRDPNLPAK